MRSLIRGSRGSLDGAVAIRHHSSDRVGRAEKSTADAHHEPGDADGSEGPNGQPRPTISTAVEVVAGWGTASELADGSRFFSIVSR